MYQRPIFQTIVARLAEPRHFIQVLAGPRQVGKTTLAQQAADSLGFPYQYASADEPTLRQSGWIEQQWDLARLKAKQENKETLLILDEVQKIPDWSTIVKKLWDEDSRHHLPLKVMLLGSSPLLLQRGLSESLAGRFEVIRVSHWSYNEMHQAFGWNLEQYIYFGGYPGAASLIHDESRWSRYIIDSLIETTISRDILLMAPVNKPALLRRLFHLGCEYSGQILSYQKMVGQLQDAGNTTTLAHYLELLAGAGMLTGLHKYAGQEVRQRGSSPKLQVLNTALITAQANLSFEKAKQDFEFWGRLVESSVGAHLINGSAGTSIKVLYWRESNHEVDFVIQLGEKLVAIEVKSGKKKEALSGLDLFNKQFKPKQLLLIGHHGISLKEFLQSDITEWFK